MLCFQSYRTESQKGACQYYKDSQIDIKHGKSLGGSSMLNGMLYVRGSTRDYQEWEEVFGAKGWGWREVLPYFKKAERLHNTRENDPSIEEESHGREGKLHVMPAPEATEASRAFIEAAKERGYPFGDLHGHLQDEEHVLSGQVNHSIF